MSFGKRTRDARQAAPASAVAVSSGTDFDGAERPDVPRWQLLLLAAAGSIIAAFCLFVFVIPALMKAGAPAGLAAGESAPDVPGQMVFDLPVNGVSERLIKSNQELRRICINNDDEVRKVPAMVEGQQLKWQINDTPSGRIYHSFSGSSDILSCLLTHEMPRLCDAGERRKMASLLDGYASSQSQLAGQIKDAGGQQALALSAEPQQMASAGNAVTDASMTEDLAISATLINALNLVSKSGYLSANDFMSDVPDAFSAFITQSRAQPCD